MSKNVLKTIRLTSSALAISLVLCAAPSAFAEARTYNFNIPAESTAKALMDFSRQAKIQILFPYEVVADRTSPAISGEYDRATVLKLLLDGSGLEIASQTETTISLRVRESPGTASTEPATEVVVTGSRIRGMHSTSPTRIATRQDIEDAGYGQVSDYIKSLPENAGNGRGRTIMSGTAGSTYGSGAETINLRGLGPDATLTLINGHRLAADETSPAPDISIIPLDAIQRVEIVTDGASALYGSDAVAGVANFILRKDFDGIEVGTRQGTSTQGGGTEQGYNLTAGKTWASGHVLGGLDYYHQDPITAAQRDFTSDMQPENTLLDALDKTSAFLSAEQSLNDRVSLHIDGLYSERQDNITFKTRPTSEPIDGTTQVWSYLLVPGATIALPRDWTLSVDATWSRSSDREDSRYRVSEAEYAYDFTNSTVGLEVSATGPLFQLPSGTVRAAAGAGYREDGVSYRGSYDNGYAGSRDVRYLYAELSAPLVSPSDDRPGLQALEISLAARTETYSDIGHTTNPKLGIRYVPVKGLNLRATWGKSFKAPSFFQTLYPSQMYLFDASLYGGTNGQILFSSGGNPDLKPETSTSWTAGLDWSPPALKGFKLTATYFNIDYTGRVVAPISSLGDVLTNPIYAPFIITTPTEVQQSALIASALSFDNYSSAAAYDPANVVAYIEDRNVNASRQTVKGVDYQISQSFDGDFGRVTLSNSGTVLNLKRNLIPTVPATTLSGTLFYPARIRMQTSLAWSYDGYLANATVNYVSSETDTNVTPNATIGSWTTLNLNLAYRFAQTDGLFSGVEASVSVVNALDRDPPRALGAAFQTSGMYFDSANASVIGRFIALTLRKHM